MKFHRKATVLFSALAILGGVAVCDLPVTADNTVYAAETQLTISKGVLSLGKGESFKLTANKSVKWRTSAPKIVTVDQSGNVKAVGNGTAWVTGKATDGKEKSCKITVKNAPSKITLSKGIVTIGVGEKFSVTSTIQNETACAKRTYRTSNSSIVKMTRTDWQGDFVGVKPGVAYVTVRSYNGKESTCKVTVRKAPTWVSISKKNLTMTVGQSATLSAGIASDAGCASRTFRTSNSSIVKMTKTNWTGSFTAVKPGTAWVTVRTYNGKESSCKVTVKAKEQPKPSTIKVTSITLNKTNVTLEEGKTTTLTATVNPSNATNKNVTWSSDNTSIATVNNGKVTAKKAGTANIIATSNNGKTAKCQITVKSKPVEPSKPKVKKIEIDPFTVGSTTGTTMTVLKLWPANADISNLKITIVNNPDNIISYSKMSRQPGNGSIATYDVYFKVNKNATKDAIGKVKVECNGITSYAEFTVESPHDSRYENYYGPFTKEKINAIVKDMRKYGESLGMTWNNSYNITWNATQTEYTCDQSFYFPTLIRGNEGLALRNQLFKEVRRPCEEENDYEYTQFKVVPIQVYSPGTVDHGDWSFYVLYG